MQTLDSAIKGVPKDRNGKISKEYLGVALDSFAASAGLPPLGAVEQVRTYLLTMNQVNQSFIISFITELLHVNY